jgi:uncharacterized membrane protein YebE (DUF533 family)
MDAEHILGSLIEGALSGRRGRRRAMGRLTGGSGSLINAKTLMAAAGLAWGLFEAAQGGSGGASSPSASSGTPGPGGAPPLPAGVSGGSLGQKNGPSEGLRRLVRLAISAARADGDLSLEERGRILARAREVGAEGLVTEELTALRPLAEIVSGVTDPELKAELYTLAYNIVRSDDGVTGAERIYLAQLAHQLGLDPAATQRLETETDARGGAPA